MIHILLLASLLGLGTAPVYAAADSSASPATKNLLTYLTNLPNQASHRLISGQWGGWNGMSSTSLARQERIYALTGHYPGVIGLVRQQVDHVRRALVVDILGERTLNAVLHVGSGDGLADLRTSRLRADL